MGERMRRRRKKEIAYFDYSLLFIVLFLIGFGLIMIYSTSSYEANITYGSSAYYLRKQLLSTILGLGAMFFIAKIDYHIWGKVAQLSYIVSIVLVVLVLSPLGIERNGARRWLNLGMSLQPAEVCKLSIILLIALIVSKLGKRITTQRGILMIIVPPLIMAGMIFIITSNLSSAVIVVGIAVVMLFVASPDYKKFILIALAGIAFLALALFAIIQLAENGSLGFRGQRILAWIDPEKYASGKGFQTLQALYAIGSGGIFGKGIGQSMQKLGFIPEAQNDMIFSIICEELGLFGAVAVILLFVLLIWRCMVIANNAPDLFGAMIVVGVMGHFAIQVVLNIAVVTNTIPNTGITLPFISYGGTSSLFLLTEIGLVLSVSGRIRFKES